MTRADDVVPEKVSGLDVEGAAVGQGQLRHVRERVVERAGSEEMDLGLDAAPRERVAGRALGRGVWQVDGNASVEHYRERDRLENLVGPDRIGERLLVFFLPESDPIGLLGIAV